MGKETNIRPLGKKRHLHKNNPGESKCIPWINIRPDHVGNTSAHIRGANRQTYRPPPQRTAERWFLNNPAPVEVLPVH